MVLYHGSPNNKVLPVDRSDVTDTGNGSNGSTTTTTLMNDTVGTGSSHRQQVPILRKVNTNINHITVNNNSKRTHSYHNNRGSMIQISVKYIVICSCSFIIGCLFTLFVAIHIKLQQSSTPMMNHKEVFFGIPCLSTSQQQQQQQITQQRERNNMVVSLEDVTGRSRTNTQSTIDQVSSLSLSSTTSIQQQQQQPQHHSILYNLKILVVIVAYDFSQLPHLEEVLNGYHDICICGVQNIDIIIHATVPYPITLIDLLNTRITCKQYTITIVLKPKSLRLFLVDEHRHVFYNNINNYDLFIYTEDDIRITPTTVATYLYETQYIQSILSVPSNQTDTTSSNKKHIPSDFNVGIVRYEYNYPTNVIIDDNTRHATQNVTRVYWEHSGFDRPVVGNAVQQLLVNDYESEFVQRYIYMKNHHQGMYLATRELLLQWKNRSPSCDFSNPRPRPGKHGQPTEGTQRVWMSSQMLYGNRHCGVQQVIPKETFGALTVLHLPNKNYRRVGKYRNRQFADGTEVFETPHESLLTAMELHLSVRKLIPSKPKFPYRGIRMIDEVTKDRTPLLERRMREYEDYVKRGGVLSDYDMTKTALVEEE